MDLTIDQELTEAEGPGLINDLYRWVLISTDTGVDRSRRVWSDDWFIEMGTHLFLLDN